MGSKHMVICIILGSLSLGLAHQIVQKHLVMNISPIDYTGEEFIAPPSGRIRAIYYPGEEIKFRIILFNDQEEGLFLNSRGTKITQHILIRWVERPDERRQSILMFQPGNAYRGLNVKPATRIEHITILGPKESISTEWALVAKDESVLVPGEYEFRATYVLPDEIQKRLRGAGQRVVVHSASFRFEVREPMTFEDRLETLYRAAVREYYLNRDHAKAVAKLKQLLAIYPTSSTAYSFLGDISFNLGEYTQAIRYGEKAIELLESGADAIRLRYSGAGYKRDHLIAMLRGKIRLARERLQRK